MEELQRLAERMSRRIRFDIMAKGAFVIDTSDPAAMEKMMEDPRKHLMREQLTMAESNNMTSIIEAPNRRARRKADALERKRK